jgi:hypothetical protein
VGSGVGEVVAGTDGESLVEPGVDASDVGPLVALAPDVAPLGKPSVAESAGPDFRGGNAQPSSTDVRPALPFPKSNVKLALPGGYAQL